MGTVDADGRNLRRPRLKVRWASLAQSSVDVQEALTNSGAKNRDDVSSSEAGASHLFRPGMICVVGHHAKKQTMTLHI